MLINNKSKHAVVYLKDNVAYYRIYFVISQIIISQILVIIFKVNKSSLTGFLVIKFK